MKDALADEVADEAFDSQLRVLGSGFEDSVYVGWGENAWCAFVFSGLGLESLEVAVFPAVVPVQESGGGIEFAVPLSLAGHLCSADQREVLVDSLLDEADGCVASQCQGLGFGYVVRCIFHIAIVFGFAIGCEFWAAVGFAERQMCVVGGQKIGAIRGHTKDFEVNLAGG